MSSAQFEILGILPNFNSFIRQTNIGMIKHIQDIASSNENLSIRLLIAEEISKEKCQEILTLSNKTNCSIEIIGEVHRLPLEFKFKNINNFKMRSINSKLKTEIGFVIVDRSKSIIVESKNDSSSNALLSIGLSSYSNSERISTSYASIFEALWSQSELNDRLKIHDSLQQEFIHIAAHELKTPVQSLLGYSDPLLNKTGHIEDYNIFIEKINKNTKRLVKLIDKILDVTQIENELLILRKEKFNVEEIILEIIKEYQIQLQKLNKNHLDIQYSKFNYDNEDAETNFGMIYADKFRIIQVLMNIMENSIHFTEKGKIIVSVQKSENNGEVIIRIDDSGAGIHPEMLPKLFMKFSTNSRNGTGLGLYICKKIIEAHGGKIWAENHYKNNKITGSRFYLSIPSAI